MLWPCNLFNRNIHCNLDLETLWHASFNVLNCISTFMSIILKLKNKFHIRQKERDEQFFNS